MSRARNRMTCIAAGLVLGLSVTGLGGEPAGSPADVAIRIGAIAPTSEQDWDGGVQIEGQCRFWQDEHVGVALSVGMDQWHAREEYAESGDASYAMVTLVSGDTTLIPIGVSLLYRMPISMHAQWVLEGGVRYVFVDSSVVASLDYVDGAGGYYLEDTIRAENFAQGVVGLSLEGSIDEPLRFMVGVSYQFDLTEPIETFDGEDLGATCFDAVVFKIGFSADF